jgi:hypothetical protein
MEAGPRDRQRQQDRQQPIPDEAQEGFDTPDADPAELGGPPRLTLGDDVADRPEPGHRGEALDGEPLGDTAPDEGSFRELRPPRRLRFWQLVPIVAIGTLGSLMFAFPLAFEFGDGGPVVAMLGLLLSCCSAGWAVMAARRVGYTWPGLPARGSGDRPDWRFVAGYTCFAVLLALLAVWRVARLH